MDMSSRNVELLGSVGQCITESEQVIRQYERAINSGLTFHFDVEEVRVGLAKLRKIRAAIGGNGAGERVNQVNPN